MATFSAKQHPEPIINAGDSVTSCPLSTFTPYHSLPEVQKLVAETVEPFTIRPAALLFLEIILSNVTPVDM